MPQSRKHRAAARVLDISRLLSRIERRSPTGIDRVELAYARHFLANAAEQDVRFLLTTPLNTGLLARSVARNVVRTAVERWTAPGDGAERSPAFARLREILEAPVQPDGTRRSVDLIPHARGLSDAAAGVAKTRAYVQAALNGWLAPRLSAIRRAPVWYLHVSHINLDRPSRLNWLRTTRLRRMFLVHDLIPISHPEYCRAGDDVRHRRRVETIARLADVVIFNSRATQKAWLAHVDATGLPQPFGEVVPLAVEDVFRAKCAGSTLNPQIPYFVVVGTIEARKNLSFLLHIWRQWTQKGPAPPARLVIVGRRGWESENVFDLLDRSTALAPTVVEVAELEDAAIATLLRGARALLAPSLIEGFGLPIAEALALGVPVIASDTDAHREVGGAFAEYIDPIDGPGWLAALDDYVRPSSPRREAMRLRAEAYRASSWADHIQAVEAILVRQS
jgi:glycosyltransferase involved in cell wall biosynthesis